MVKNEIEKTINNLTGIIEDCIELKIFNGSDKISMFEVYKFVLKDLLPHVEDQDKLFYEAIDIIKMFKTGDCFCEKGIDNPMIKTHSEQCIKIKEFLDKIENA